MRSSSRSLRQARPRDLAAARNVLTRRLPDELAGLVCAHAGAMRIQRGWRSRVRVGKGDEVAYAGAEWRVHEVGARLHVLRREGERGGERTAWVYNRAAMCLLRCAAPPQKCTPGGRRPR